MKSVEGETTRLKVLVRATGSHADIWKLQGILKLPGRLSGNPNKCTRGLQTCRVMQTLAIFAMSEGKRTKLATASRNAGKPIIISRKTRTSCSRACNNVELLKKHSASEGLGFFPKALLGALGGCVTGATWCVNLDKNGSVRHNETMQLQFNENYCWSAL